MTAQDFLELRQALSAAILENNTEPLKKALSINDGGAFIIVRGVTVRIWRGSQWRIEAGSRHITITPETIDEKIGVIREAI